MKKWLTIFLTLGALLLAAAGCGGGNSNGSSSSSDTSKDEKQMTEKKETTDSQKKSNDQTDKMDSSNTGSTKNDTSTNKAKTLTPKEVIAATKTQIAAKNIYLPTTIPLSSDSKHLTALTSGDQGNYKVRFFESDNPIPINNAKLKDGKSASEVATVSKKTYATNNEAKQAVGHTDPQTTGSKPVDLGHGIKGYPDAGAGNKYLNWNEGRWSFVVHAINDGKSDYEPLAKEVVAKLEKETLVIPHEVGDMKLDSEKNNRVDANTVSWQEGKSVYTITSSDAIEAVTMATHFDKIK